MVPQAFQQSQNAQRPLFHLLSLCGGFVEPGLEVCPSVFSGELDGGFHTVGKNDELRWPAVIMGAKADDVYLSHSGPENSEKSRQEQEGLGFTPRPVLQTKTFFVAGTPTEGEEDFIATVMMGYDK